MPHPSTQTALRLALALATITLAATQAHADCAPIVAAYAKADATRRFAIYMVDSMAEAPKGKPFHVSVDGKSATDTGYGKEYMNSGGGIAASEGSSLASDEKGGRKHCEALGDGKVGGEAVTGYSIERSDVKGKDPLAIHFWISKQTGLPLYHGMGSDSGLRWVYGPGVVMPAVIKR